MTTAPCPAKTITFYQLLENTPELDQRDNRGKRHAVALVLTSLIAALLCGRDGSLSRLHRHMTNQFDTLLIAMQLTDHKPISRAQLPLLLAKVNGLIFAQLLFDWWGFVLDAETKKWFALDGKELRGSIQQGRTRGEVVVSAVAHHEGQVLAQTYYCGTKESERPAVATLIESQHLAPPQTHAGRATSDSDYTRINSCCPRTVCGGTEVKSGSFVSLVRHHRLVWCG